MDFFRTKSKSEPAGSGQPATGGAAGQGPEGGSAGGPASEPSAERTVDETAAAFEQLEAEVARLRAERDESCEAHKRALADFQNYQRRALQNERDAREQAVRGMLGSLMSVVDHFDMALAQDPAKTTAASIVAGVSMIRDELLGALTAHGVGLIRPAKGDAFDATRHEAVTQQADPDVPPGHIVRLLRIGYTANERVVRPAQVIVAPN